MSVVRLADAALLERFERRLRDAGALAADWLAPGLDDAQIDALTSAAGLDLPEEARVWWRWHDGTLPGAPPAASAITPFRAAVTLAAAVAESAYVASSELFGIDGLLRPVGEKPIVYFRCDGTRDAPVAIYSQGDMVQDPRLVLPSIGELVHTWITYIDEGIWRTRPDGAWVDRPPEPLSAEILRLGVF